MCMYVNRYKMNLTYLNHHECWDTHIYFMYDASHLRGNLNNSKKTNNKKQHNFIHACKHKHKIVDHMPQVIAAV